MRRRTWSATPARASATWPRCSITPATGTWSARFCALDLWRAIAKQHGHEPVLRYAQQQLAAVRSAPGGRLAAAATRGIGDLRDAVAYLAAASPARQDQQARRLADLFGDVIALSTLAVEVDREVGTGDYRKAILGELFAWRMTSAHTRRAAVLEAPEGLPDLYPALFGDGPASEQDYLAASARITSLAFSLIM